MWWYFIRVSRPGRSIFTLRFSPSYLYYRYTPLSHFHRRLHIDYAHYFAAAFYDGAILPARLSAAMHYFRWLRWGFGHRVGQLVAVSFASTAKNAWVVIGLWFAWWRYVLAVYTPPSAFSERKYVHVLFKYASRPRMGDAFSRRVLGLFTRRHRLRALGAERPKMA